jgi:pimeloyl-ACP methyl ester carboxylesterase
MAILIARLTRQPAAPVAAAGLCMLAACTEPAVATLELADCPVPGATETARCGALAVPENWDRPGDRRIRLNVMIIPALEPDGSAPLFDLAGGPGLAATLGADFYMTAGRAMRRHRDIVLVDQRGTGASAPLRCTALEAVPPITRMYPPEAVEACRQELAARHDLTRFTTGDAVEDLEAVRRALGAERVDLFGISYGTKLGQAYIRAYPDHVRAAAFLGTVPMDLRTPLEHASSAERTLQDIFADCAADEACAAAFPRLRDDWQAVLARFDAGPVSMPFHGNTVEVERGPFSEAVRATMTTDAGQQRLPAIIHAAARGDFAPFAEAVGPGGNSPIAEGLYLSAECSEGTSRFSESDIGPATAGTFLGRYRVDEQVAACRAWPRREVPRSFHEPVRAEVPVLFLAGGRDHVAPLRYAEGVAAGFPNSRVVVIDEMPHFPVAMANLECLDAMLLAFYAAGDAKGIDTSCAASMKAPPFVPREGR